MIELFFTHSIKWELKNRLLDQMALIEDEKYDQLKMMTIRLIEEVDNAETIG